MFLIYKRQNACKSQKKIARLGSSCINMISENGMWLDPDADIRHGKTSTWTSENYLNSCFTGYDFCDLPIFNCRYGGPNRSNMPYEYQWNHSG